MLSFIVDLLDVKVNIPVNFLNYTGDALKRFEGAEILVTTAILPLVTEFTTDNAPADRNVTLPGYAELVEVEKELTFFEKIMNFFKMLAETFMTLFAFVPFWK